MPLGNPIRKQNESRIVSVLATEGQTVFTVQGGYIVNHISVFRNGVRLSNSEDFTAGDGSTVTLNNAANIEDRIEFHVFDRFTVSGAIVSAASTQTISGDVVVNGKIFGNLDVPQINVASGIVTTHDLNVTGVGTFAENINANGNIVGDDSTNISGMNDVIATSLYTSDSIIHRGEVGDNTKIRFPSDDTISFETDGNEVLRITSGSDIVTSGLTDHSFNNDGSNAKVLEVSGGGGTGTYGVLNLSGNQNSSAVVGAIKFCNRENSNSSSGSNANSRRLASIDCFADTSDSNGGDDCGGYMRFVTKSDGGGGSERMRVTSSGNVEITDGDLKISTSGHGIDFSATSDSTGTTQSEILDDYEEGTWTPTIAYSSSGSATLSEALGFYTKIGRMVHVIITVTVSAQGSGSGNVNLGGLPFTTGSTNGFRLNGHLTYMTGFSNINSNITLYRAGASTHMEMFMMNSIGSTDAIVNVTRSNVGNNATIRAHATYYVD